MWKNFTKNASGNSAACNLCNISIKCVGGTTSGLIYHLQRKYCINLLKGSEPPLPFKPVALRTNFDETIATLVSVHGVTFRQNEMQNLELWAQTTSNKNSNYLKQLASLQKC